MDNPDTMVSRKGVYDALLNISVNRWEIVKKKFTMRALEIILHV